MGRGRTTTGMSVASLIATIVKGDMTKEGIADEEDDGIEDDGDVQDSSQFLSGELDI